MTPTDSRTPHWRAWLLLAPMVAWLVLFVVSQLGLIGIGLLPKKWWGSFRAL